VDDVRRRVGSEDGFMLVELLVVLVVIGILLAIAVPSYLGARDGANRATSAANVREAIPSAEAYFSDCKTYATVTAPVTCDDGASHAFSPTGLTSYDAGVKLDRAFGAAGSYCLSAQVGNEIAKVVGPGGTVEQGAASECSDATG
jgi:type IV pilus assembly protein PilA